VIHLIWDPSAFVYFSLFRDLRARWEGGRLRIAIQNMPRLLAGAMAGDLRPIEFSLDLLLLPLAHISLLVPTLAMPFSPARIYAVFSLSLAAVHVFVGLIVGGGDRSDLAALLGAPSYVAWKLAVRSKTLQSASATSPWVRTKR